MGAGGVEAVTLAAGAGAGTGAGVGATTAGAVAGDAQPVSKSVACRASIANGRQA